MKSLLCLLMALSAIGTYAVVNRYRYCGVNSTNEHLFIDEWKGKVLSCANTQCVDWSLTPINMDAIIKARMNAVDK